MIQHQRNISATINVLFALAILISNVAVATSELAVSQPLLVFVPQDFSLSFSITPIDILPGFGNILHYTQDNTEESRVPAIWLIPGSLHLRISFSTSTDANEVLDITDPLPANISTEVMVTAVGTSIQVYFDSILKGTAILQGSRITGSSFLYASDPWNTPARAVLDNIQMRVFCSSTSTQCCWVIRIWQLMGQTTMMDPTSSSACCSSNGDIPGISCSASKVTHINWSQQELYGSIPSDIANLNELQDL